MAQRRPPASKRESLFGNPGARATLQPQGSAQNFIDVHTEDELLAALTGLPRGDGNCYGKGINIVASITLTRALTLAAGDHDGLTLMSPGRARISAGGFALTVAAADVVVQDLDFTSLGTFTISGNRAGISRLTLTNCKGISITGADVIVSDIPKMTAATGAGAAFSVDDFGVSISNVRMAAGTSVFTSCLALAANAGQVVFEKINAANGVTTSGILVSAPDPVSEIWVEDCFFPSGVVADAITISGALWVVRGNRLSTQSVIRAGAVGGSAVIAGNLFVGSIITNAGTGLNTISHNVEVTTITAHGTDNTTGGNT